MSSVVIAGNTSGSVTLAAPDVAGTTTLTLPATSGQVLTQNFSAPSNSFVVDAGGNVGIGTASPSSKLTVGANPPTSGAIAAVGSSGGISLALSDNVNSSLYVRNAAGGAIIGTDGGGNLRFATNGNTSSEERMRIDSSGRVTKPYQPAFFAVPTAGFTTTASGSYFSFNSLNGTFCSSNRSSGYNTSTLVYTAPVAGLYQFYISLYMNGTTISAQWFKNGVGMSYGDAALMIFQSGTTTQIVNGTVIVELAAGDYIGVQPRGGSATVGYYGGHSCFFGYLIG